MRATVCSGLSALCLVAIGCGQSAGTPPQTVPDAGGSGGSTVNGSGGAAGQDAGSGGSQGATGGATAPGSGGAAPTDATPADDTGASGDAGNDAGPTVPQNFTCTLIIGAAQTGQWFDGGFETAVGTAKWEIKSDHNTFTEAWANPADAFWNLPVMSPCTASATTPDRALFVVYSKTITAAADWETQINKVMTNIKTKFPSVKQIELLTMARGPGNKICGTAAATTISATQDQAMQSVADKSAGAIKVGPQYFAPTCAAFATPDNTNLTTAGAAAIGQMVAASYK